MSEIIKPNFPPHENGSWPFLASSGLSSYSLSTTCIERAEVVKVSDLDSNLVSIKFEDVVYHNIPVWMHTDIGTRISAENNTELDNPEEYFKRASAQFVFFDQSQYLIWDTVSHDWIFGPIAYPAKVSILCYRKDSFVPKEKQRVIAVVNILSHRNKTTGPWPTYKILMAVFSKFVTADNETGVDTYQIYDVETGELARIPDPTFTKLVDADFASNEAGYEYFFKQDGNYEGVSKIANVQSRMECKSHYREMNTYSPYVYSPHNTGCRDDPSGICPKCWTWVGPGQGVYTYGPSSGWWQGPDDGFGNFNLAAECSGSTYTGSATTQGAIDTVTRTYELYKTDQNVAYLDSDPPATSIWGDTVIEYLLPNNTTNTMKRVQTFAQETETKIIDFIDDDITTTSIARTHTSGVTINGNYYSCSETTDFHITDSDANGEKWTGTYNEVTLVERGPRIFDNNYNGYVSSPNFMINTSIFILALFFLKRVYIEANTWQQDFFTNNSPHEEIWTAIPGAFEFIPYFFGEEGAGALGNRFTEFSELFASAVERNRNRTVQAGDWSQNCDTFKVDFFAVPFDFRTKDLPYDPNYTGP